MLPRMETARLPRIPFFGIQNLVLLCVLAISTLDSTCSTRYARVYRAQRLRVFSGLGITICLFIVLTVTRGCIVYVPIRQQRSYMKNLRRLCLGTVCALSTSKDSLEILDLAAIAQKWMAVAAPTGAGKTQILQEYLELHPTYRILSISPRISMARTAAGRLGLVSIKTCAMTRVIPLDYLVLFDPTLNVPKQAIRLIVGFHYLKSFPFLAKGALFPNFLIQIECRFLMFLEVLFA